jgi:DNA-binding transcriptional LysR family regulator
LTLEQLRIFVAVAERENMTRASDALGLVQSAVSSAIGTLERQHGVTLFHRIGRRIQLTDEGRIFLDEAKAVLSRASTAELTLTELGGLRAGVLSIHASQTIASYWLPKYLVRYREKYPKISIRLSIGNTSQVAKAVASGDAELGFVEGQVADPVIEDEVIEGDRLVVVVGMKHSWARRDQIEPHELVDSDWVLREPGSGTRSEFEEALTVLGIAPTSLRLALELPSNEAVRTAVESGNAATATSELVAARGFSLGTLHKVGIELPARAFHVLRHRQRYRSKAAEALLDLISDTTSGKG